MNTFQSNILNIYGGKGKAWLAELPELVAVISSKRTSVKINGFYRDFMDLKIYYVLYVTKYITFRTWHVY